MPELQSQALLKIAPSSYRHLRRGCFVIKKASLNLAFYRHRVAAGPASDVEELLEQSLDLNEYLGQNSPSIFCIRVSGDSMIGAGIYDNDLLVVDRALEPVEGKIVIAAVNNELTLKRLQRIDGQIVLMPENSAYAPIVICEGIDLKIWGVVVHVLHRLD